MKIYDGAAFLSRCDESAQILEDWINRTTSEDHAQLNKLACLQVDSRGSPGTELEFAL